MLSNQYNKIYRLLRKSSQQFIQNFMRYRTFQLNRSFCYSKLFTFEFLLTTQRIIRQQIFKSIFLRTSTQFSELPWVLELFQYLNLTSLLHFSNNSQVIMINQVNSTEISELSICGIQISQIQMSITGSDLFNNGRAFKYCFDLQIEKLQMQMPFSCSVDFSWRRKNNNFKTPKSHKCLKGQKVFLINEKLQLHSTCYLNTNSLQFESRQSTISVVINYQEALKSGGQFNFDLCSILNPLNYKQSRSKYFQAQLSRCPIKNSKIYLKLSASYIHEMVPQSSKNGDRSSVRSITSGFVKALYDPQNMNSSQYSVSSEYQQQNYGFSEKKCESPIRDDSNSQKFKQINAKDTYSVTSYGGPKSSFNYPQSKDPRTSSNSNISPPVSTYTQKRQNSVYQYNYVKKQKQGLGAKVVATIKNQGNQYALNCKPVNTYNLHLQNLQNLQKNVNNYRQGQQSNMSPTSTFKSTSQNKREFGQNSKFTQRSCSSKYKENGKQKDSQLGKQLSEQQNRRSKVQAQYNKLNIMYGERDKKLKQFVTQNYKLKQELKKTKQAQTVPQDKTSQLNIAHADIQKLKQQKEEIMKKLQQLKSESCFVKQTLSYQQNRRRSLQQQNQGLKHQHSEVLRRCSSIQIQLSNCKRQLQTAELNSLQYNKIVQQLKNENHYLKDEKRSIKQQLRDFDDFKTQVQSLKNQLDQQLKNRYKERQSMQKEIHDRIEKIQQIKSQGIEKDKAIENFKYQSQKSQKQIREITSELDTKNRKNTELTFRVDDLQRISNILQNQKRILLGQVQRLKAEISTKNNELDAVKQNMSRVRDDKTAQYQQKNHTLRQQNLKLNEINKRLHFDIQQCMKDNRRLSQNNFSLNRQIQQRKRNVFVMQGDIKRLKAVEQKFGDVSQQNSRKQREIREISHDLRQKTKLVEQKQKQLQKLQQQFNEFLSKNQQQNCESAQRLIRQKLQMEIHIKYLQQENQRLKPLQSELNNIKYELQIFQQNKKQNLQTIQRLQKQVRDKNRACMIQIEKNKLNIEERNAHLRNLNEVKSQLDRYKKIVINGQAQLRQLDCMNLELNEQLIQKEDSISKLGSQIRSLKNSANNICRSQVKNYERRIQQLQQRNAQKIISMEKMSKNIAQCKDQISQMRALSEQKQQQIRVKNGLISQLNSQKEVLCNIKTNIESEMVKQINQFKSLQRKNSILMQQLHSSKKRYQQQKVRSTSITNIRSSQDISRLRNLENELSKKDQKIRKLQKEVIKLEDQNVQLNIRIMRELSDNKNTPTSGNIATTTTLEAND